MGMHSESPSVCLWPWANPEGPHGGEHPSKITGQEKENQICDFFSHPTSAITIIQMASVLMKITILTGAYYYHFKCCVAFIVTVHVMSDTIGTMSHL
jgi:hypothetical protein